MNISSLEQGFEILFHTATFEETKKTTDPSLKKLMLKTPKTFFLLLTINPKIFSLSLKTTHKYAQHLFFALHRQLQNI